MPDVPRLPATRRDDVVDVLHGESVADPYRWLEGTDSEETARWVGDQNAVTSAYLAARPGRAEIRARLAELWDVTRHTPPYEHGGRWFFTRHDAGADQPVLLVAEDPGDSGRILVDPNTLSDDGTVALLTWAVSPDGRRVAYATSESGSDWMTHRVVDVESGEVLAGVVRWSKWTTAAWLPDGSGFYYGALTPPTPGREHLAPNEAVRLKLHLLGRPQPTDEVVYADPDPKREPEASTLDRGRWLVVATRAGTDPRSVVMVADQHAAPRQLKVLIPQPDFDSSVIGNDGETFYVLTDDGAPNKRLVAIDLGDPARGSWREVIPEGKDALLEVAQVGSRLVAHSLHDASSRLQVWSASGEHLRDITVPPFATVTGLSGGQGPLLHFGISSFTDPASVWMCDVETGEVRRIRDAGLPIAADEVAVSRASTTSVDGTEVPMFLIHRRDTRPSGDVRTMLYGYGGFDIPITPDFKPAWLAWVERGGLLAVANLRGGGEFGKGWYEAGRRENKQNVFDDFAACARWLVEVGWTRPSRLVVNGASNGGLLVGALLTQHPELTGAAVPEVGVLDMLRYHRFTIGWAWMDDYGDPDDSEEYRWVRAYSPLHAIRPGTAYPPTLVMTGDHDDRVVPGHSFKFAAALQAAQGGPAPVLIRVETAAGHGANTPVSKLIDARADMLAFCEAAVD